jgi:hypothetical protein
MQKNRVSITSLSFCRYQRKEAAQLQVSCAGWQDEGVWKAGKLLNTSPTGAIDTTDDTTDDATDDATNDATDDATDDSVDDAVDDAADDATDDATDDSVDHAADHAADHAVDHAADDAANDYAIGPTTDNTTSGSSDIVTNIPKDKAELIVCSYIDKIKRGFGKLDTATRKNTVPGETTLSIGDQLFHYREHVAGKTTNSQNTPLEDILETYTTQVTAGKWLADFNKRYIKHRWRKLDPSFSESGVHDVEFWNKRAEVFCAFTSDVVNSLEPRWGPFALLIFNALEGM